MSKVRNFAYRIVLLPFVGAVLLLMTAGCASISKGGASLQEVGLQKVDPKEIDARVIARTRAGGKIELMDSIIETEGVQRDVIRGRYKDITLKILVYIAPEVFGHNYRYSANFRTVRLKNLSVQNNYFEDTHYTGEIDRDFSNAGYWYIWLYWGDAKDAVRGDYGTRIFEPYFLVDTGTGWEDGDVQWYHGTSEYSIANKHYFLIEGNPHTHWASD